VTSVAVIQPYFVPYAGYFRLFTAADAVVLFDCVQFPRRGWVHRNRFATSTGEPAWLTLPLQKAEREVAIADLRFTPDAPARLEAQVCRFPTLESARKQQHPLLARLLGVGESGDVTEYLVDLIRDVVAILGIERPMLRSSRMSLPNDLRGQDRVIAAVKAAGGNRYVNPSGGRELYDHASFAESGVELGFLSPYGGSYASVLTRLIEEPPDQLAAEIRRETVVTP
jgi:hypothetical protein